MPRPRACHVGSWLIACGTAVALSIGQVSAQETSDPGTASIITLEEDLATPAEETESPEATPAASEFVVPAEPDEAEVAQPLPEASAENMDAMDAVIAPAPEELDPLIFADPPPAPREAFVDPEPVVQTERPTSLEPPAEQILERELESDPNVALPAQGVRYFPDLTNPLDPVFQREGLKFRIGELHLRFPIRFQTEYDDNIFQAEDDPTSDIISSISPTILAGIGEFRDRRDDFFTLRYTPQFQFFAENSDLNTINEFLEMAGQYQFQRLTTSGAFTYSRNENPTSGTQGRRERTNFRFVWENSFAVGAKTFAEVITQASYENDANSIDYTTASISPRIAYQYSPKLRLSLGPEFGVTIPSDDAGTQTFQNLNLSASYNTLMRFSFNGMVGIQARQYENDPVENEDIVTPIWSLGTTYEIKPGNTVALNFNRTVNNSSFLSGQTVITNSIILNYEQLLLTRIRFGLSVTYQILEYQGDQEATDNYVRARPSLTYSLLEEVASLSVFYERIERTSDNVPTRDFQNNTFGVSLNILY